MERAAVISVVIPARNCAALLTEQLEALEREQVPVATEIVVADNGSTDGTPAVAAVFETAPIPVRVVDAGARPGINHARNVGARASSGRFLLFCDADDRVEPGWIAAMWAAAGRGSELLGGSLVRIDERGRAGQPSRGPANFLGFLPWPQGANCGCTKDVFDAIGGFDESYRGGGDETDFFWRAQLEGRPLAFVPDAKIAYRERTSLRSRWRQQRAYGHSHVGLFARFRDQGMPRASTRNAARFWLTLPYELACALILPSRRARLVSRLAQRIGRLEASLELHTWYP
jgi:GT2 family glycosyltransferase